MKYTIYLFTLGFIILTSCKKEQETILNTDQQTTNYCLSEQMKKTTTITPVEEKENTMIKYEWTEGTSAPLGYPMEVYKGGMEYENGGWVGLNPLLCSFIEKVLLLYVEITFILCKMKDTGL